VGVSRTENPGAMQAEKHLFKFSIVYLFALFAALVADRMIFA
jgi:protoheme IX farnesyltransferase